METPSIPEAIGVLGMSRLPLQITATVVSLLRDRGETSTGEEGRRLVRRGMIVEMVVEDNLGDPIS
jgi:hypothetical protein